MTFTRDPVSRHPSRLAFHVLTLLMLTGHLIFSSSEVQAMGKKYSEQGAKLTAAMNSALLSQGMCKTPRECHDLLPGTLETDSEVAIAFFGVGDKNHAAFLAVVGLALTEGIRITSGIPISIQAYRETQEEHRRSGVFIKDIKPFATIEAKNYPAHKKNS